MTANVLAAKLLLDYPPGPIVEKNVRRCFRHAVLKGHADRGGIADIASLVQARDLLLSLSTLCLYCTEQPLLKTNVCLYHSKFI